MTKFCSQVLAQILFAGLLGLASARADCTLTNIGLTPLTELGLNSYSNYSGGLYPNGANQRPPAHEAAGLALAQALQPLDAAGNPDTNSGKIVLLSLGLSNTTQEWATKGTNNFTRIATNDPSLNPRVRIVDGAIGGQDAPRWTNASAANWDTVITQRLVQASVTTNQVAVLWFKTALASPVNYGAFPLHAQALQNDMAIILRVARSKFPNLKLVYISCRTRAYTAIPTDLNPEPFAFETAFADKWVIEDQIAGRNNLNFNPASGPVVAPWISWGPYLWADGTTTRGDGFTWLCNDLESDYTHPSPTNGVAKVAQELLAFFKTDPTTTPWFLKKNGAGAPTCAPSAGVTNGVMPLTVNFSANAAAGSAPLRDARWTFEDGGFATNVNPVKIFPAPGTYHARLTVTDTNGNTAQGVVTISVSSKFDLWRAAKFTPAEFANTNLSGAAGNPDGDSLPNLLEYAMALEPKISNATSVVSATLSNGVFKLSFPHYKPATDAPLSVEVSSDFVNWSSAAATQTLDLGPIEMLTHQETVTTNPARFFRLKSVLQ